MTERTIEWDDGEVVIIDQTLLPDREERVRLRSADEVADAIRSLRVRGAPALGAAAIFAKTCGSPRITPGTFITSLRYPIAGLSSSRATVFASSVSPAVSNSVAGTQDGAPKQK